VVRDFTCGFLVRSSRLLPVCVFAEYNGKNSKESRLMGFFSRALIFVWIAFAAIVTLVFLLPKPTVHFLGFLFFPLSLLGLIIATAVQRVARTYKAGMKRGGNAH
jgi:hypothetical protein